MPRITGLLHCRIRPGAGLSGFAAVVIAATPGCGTLMGPAGSPDWYEYRTAPTTR
jgi:hypothetical protein